MAATVSAPGFIVATSFKGYDEWELRASHAARPSADVMRQYHAAWKRLRVRVFTDAEWDALPVGAQSGDWVWASGERSPRFPDGVRTR